MIRRLFSTCNVDFHYMCIWNKIYKNTFLKNNNIRFASDINFEDNLFFLETFILAKKINYTKCCLVNYRYSSSTSYSTKTGAYDYKKLDFFKLMDLEKKFLKEINLYNTIKKSFDFHQKTTLLYWFNKITDKKTKFIYGIKLFLKYPSLLLEKMFLSFEINNIIKRLNFETQKSTIMFRGASLLLENILNRKELKNKQNIIGIIDKNPNKIGKNINGFEIYDYSILDLKTPDKLILSDRNIFNFDKIVQIELESTNKNICIDSEIFNILKSE